MLEESDPYSGWTTHDYRLQEAMHILDSEKCKTCGNPVWLCHSPSNLIEFELRTAACYADAELKDFDKNNPSAPPLETGEYRYAVPVGLKNEDDGTYDPLPSRREALEAMG